MRIELVKKRFAKYSSVDDFFYSSEFIPKASLFQLTALGAWFYAPLCLSPDSRMTCIHGSCVIFPGEKKHAREDINRIKRG